MERDPFLPAFPPAVVLIPQQDALGRQGIQVTQINGNVTLLDYFASYLSTQLPISCEELTDGMLDTYTAQVWRWAASMIRTRPVLAQNNTGKPMELLSGGAA